MSLRLVGDYWKHFSSKIHTSIQFSFCFHPGFGSSAQMYYDTTLQEAVFRGLKCHSNELSRTTKFIRLIANYLHEDYNSVLYGKAQNLGRVLCKAYDEAFEKYDVLILPTIPKKAPVFPQQNPSLKGNVVTFVNMLLYLRTQQFRKMREVGALFISVPSMSVCTIRHFGNERELGRVNSRKDFWNCN